MKKLIIAVAVCVFTMSATAQKVMTPEMLLQLGKVWNYCAEQLDDDGCADIRHNAECKDCRIAERASDKEII